MLPGRLASVKDGKSLVNLGSVTTAEIFLIWTNVTRTNGSFKDGSRILPLKFGQYWVSNSWDKPKVKSVQIV